MSVKIDSNEVTESIKLENNPHTVDYCDEKGCKNIATVFVTETFTKKKYCYPHFKQRLMK